MYSIEEMKKDKKTIESVPEWHNAYSFLWKTFLSLVIIFIIIFYISAPLDLLSSIITYIRNLFDIVLKT